MMNARRAYWLCCLLQLRGLRGSALTFFLQSVAVPLVLLGGLRAAHLIGTPAQQAFASAGSSVLALLGVALLALPGAMARMRERGQLGYLAAFPLEHTPFLLAQLTVYSLLALPAALLAPLAGAYIIGIAPSWPPLLPLALLCSSVAFTASGLLIGLLAPKERGAIAAGTICYVALAAGPIFLLLPPHQLPVLHWLGALAPTGVAADAMTALLNHDLTGVPLDLLVLVLYSVVALLLANRLLPWRTQRSAALIAAE